ncbi:MAG: P-loop ATPase, Sll1717 family [Janthinobacterium lividum]
MGNRKGKSLGSDHKKLENKFKFNKLQSIGSPDAESDHSLNKVFIENGEIEVLGAMDDAKCIIVGRTGSGKSALIKRFEEVSTGKVVRIQPETMSLKFISNSVILNYFRELGVNLAFFYKVLWKHVFVVEILRLYIDDDYQKKENFFEGFKNRIAARFGKSTNAKQKAIEYVEKWSDQFWLNAEYRVKELEEEVSSKFTAAAGVKVGPFSGDIKNEAGETLKSKTEVKNKAEKVINEIQANELVDLIEILKRDVLDSYQRKYFIVIDDLDKEWVSAQVVYDLIAAMIEVIKEFQVFKGCKIIIALRDNLHQLVFSAQEHRGGQREKFASLYLNLEWDEQSLKSLIDKRIKLISNNTLAVSNVFEKAHNGIQNGFDYVIERTFLRPRDVISFVNKIISKANSKSFFETSLIKQAEPEYSLERLHAIEDEWSENYGEIRELWRVFYGVYNGFKIVNFNEDKFADIYVDRKIINSFKGEMQIIFSKWRDEQIKYKEFIQNFFYLMFRIGVIGLKKTGMDSVVFFYTKESFIVKSDFIPEAKIFVHKAFYSSLKINTKSLEPGY